LRSRILAALGAFALLAGCSAHETLEAHWFPLAEIVEAKETGLTGGRVMTLYSTLVTGDLAAVDSWYPAGSVEREALLRHEQAHSVREFQDPLWLVKYTASPAFRWQEEQVGYREEILWLRNHQRPVDAYQMAWSLANLYDGMVSLDDALAWVMSVLREP